MAGSDPVAQGQAYDSASINASRGTGNRRLYARFGLDWVAGQCLPTPDGRDRSRPPHGRGVAGVQRAIGVPARCRRRLVPRASQVQPRRPAQHTWL